MGYSPKQKSQKYQALTFQEASACPVVNGIPERGIKPSVCKFFDVRQEFSDVDGKVIAHLFPVTKKGKITGFVRRDLTKSKRDQFAFTTIGDVSVESDLLGQHVAPTARKLFIVEGLYDYLSAFQALMFSDYNMQRRREGKDMIKPAVVSIALGTANAAEQINNNLEFINKYQEKVTAFDNDSATDKEAKEGIVKGQDAVQDVSLLIPDLKNVVLTKNDPNEFLQTGLDEDVRELNNQLVFNAKSYQPDNMISGCVGIDEIMKPLKNGFYVPCLPKTSELIHGFRPEEMTIVLAPPGVGKTTVCKEIGYALVTGGAKVGHVFLEEPLRKTQQSYVAMDNGVFLPKFRADPSILTRKQVQASIDKLIDNGRTMWMKHFGSLAGESLMQKFMWMHMKGMEYIILDHISMVFSGQASKNERKDIDMLLTELAAFATATGVHPIVVSHVKRVNKMQKRDKEGNVVYPYWEEVTEDMARGSGAFEQTASNIISIEPERLENRERGRIRTVVLKNREWSWLGKGDLLTLNPHTGRLITLDEEY